MMQRRFVLEPLSELAPDLRHPENMRSIRDLLGETLSQTVRKTAIQIGAPCTEPRA
jgi:7,8-dihydro-6-hydroxymethylpterin-pyrophosphokinase